MDVVDVRRVDETFCFVECDDGIAQELADLFTFEVPGAKWSPKVKLGVWDGKIRLFNPLLRMLYRGNIYRLVEFCRQRRYELRIDPELYPVGYKLDETWWSQAVRSAFEKRDYQMVTIRKCLERDRSLVISPTSSGKSIIIYALCSHYAQTTGRPSLVIVPNKGLVTQMAGDFADYSGGRVDPYQIVGGVPKDVEGKGPYVVTTWQSVYKLPRPWFNQFGCIIGDEAHGFDAKSLQGIMEKANEVRFRHGFTGSLDGSKVHLMVLEGLFGPLIKEVDTKTLMDQGFVAKLEVNVVRARYSENVRKLNYAGVMAAKKLGDRHAFQEEMRTIVGHQGRVRMIADLVKGLKGNVLVLFRLVKLQGEVLVEALGPETHFVHGGVSKEEREEIRRAVELSDGCVTVASYGVFSTGINIRRLHHVVFASPFRSKIRLLQSIGRGLRTAEGKSRCTVWDVADDLRWKKWNNLTWRQMESRIEQYGREGFKYRFVDVDLIGAWDGTVSKAGGTGFSFDDKEFNEALDEGF